jgi:hypothetical protein
MTVPITSWTRKSQRQERRHQEKAGAGQENTHPLAPPIEPRVPPVEQAQADDNQGHRRADHKTPQQHPVIARGIGCGLGQSLWPQSVDHCLSRGCRIKTHREPSSVYYFVDTVLDTLRSRVNHRRDCHARQAGCNTVRAIRSDWLAFAELDPCAAMRNDQWRRCRG